MSKQKVNAPHLYIAPLPMDEATFTVQKKRQDTPLKQTIRKKSPIVSPTFHGLSINDKIAYLLNRPTYMPNMYCEITTTDNRKMKGVIYEATAEVVKVKQRRIHQEIIAKQDIIDIRLLGFSGHHTNPHITDD